MAAEYSVEVCKELEESFAGLGLHRPMRVVRYEPETELEVSPRKTGRGAAADLR